MKAKTAEEEAAYAELAGQLAQEFPGHLPLLVERATRLNSLEDEKRKERLQVRFRPPVYAKARPGMEGKCPMWEQSVSDMHSCHLKAHADCSETAGR